MSDHASAASPASDAGDTSASADAPRETTRVVVVVVVVVVGRRTRVGRGDARAGRAVDVIIIIILFRGDEARSAESTEEARSEESNR